jgi:hypothetical protein
VHLMDGHHQVFLQVGVGTNQGIIQVHPLRKTLTTQEIGIYIHIHQYMIKSIMCIIKHLPEQLLSRNIHLIRKEKLVIDRNCDVLPIDLLLS